MFERILFPTSGSGLSEKIAKTIVGLIKEKPDRKVIVLNVVDKYSLPAEVEFEMDKTGLSAEEVIKKNVEECIQKATKVFEDSHTPYKVKVRRGEPVKTIVETAEELQCDLMVIGYHGECTLMEFLFKGNIMSRLIDEAKCPVMVIK
ncbi:MAG: universal stress protein [Bacillota bacterium]|nr:universal stress protein [Bacillota bacterium]